jgi:predicted house-cleaning noncanonical NTP pyrophosphatase (MazG superfamily)
MRKFRLDKLVRDKLPEEQQKHGGHMEVRILTDEEYIQALIAKFQEEAAEIDTGNPDKALKELADLQEIIDCLAAALGKDKTAVLEAQEKKRQESGSFKARQYVSTVSLQDDDPWADYYAADPERFPELI